MTDKKVWFITGASRGMGVDFAKAALAGGHAVVATGQQPPPRRFIAGANAIAIAEQKVQHLQQQINAFRDLSTSMTLKEM